MKMILTSIIIVFSMLSGCAALPLDTSMRQEFDQMPHKYSQYDFKLAWNQKVAEDAVTVDGIAWNIRWNYADGLDIWISLIGQDGKVLAKEVYLIPGRLNMQEKAYFSVKLKAKPQSGSKLLFTYRYNGIEDPDCCGLMMQSFESKL